MKTEIKYHCGRRDLSVFGSHPKRITTAEAMNVLLDPDLDRQRVCISQPVAVENNRLFVVDLSHLKKPKDLLCDDMGSWVCNGNYTAWVVVDEVGDVETLGKSLSEEPSEGMYLVCRKYYYLRGCPDFHRMVVFVEGMYTVYVGTTGGSTWKDIKHAQILYKKWGRKHLSQSG